MAKGQKSAAETSAKQLSRFIETARALGCDEDKEKFEAQLGKIAEHKPVKEPVAKKAGKKKSN